MNDDEDKIVDSTNVAPMNDIDKIDEEDWEDIPYLPSSSSSLPNHHEDRTTRTVFVSSSTHHSTASTTPSSSFRANNEDDSDTSTAGEENDADDKEEEEETWYDMLAEYGLSTLPSTGTDTSNEPLVSKDTIEITLSSSSTNYVPTTATSSSSSSSSVNRSTTTTVPAFVYDPPYSPHLILARRTHFLALLAHHQYINTLTLDSLLQGCLLSMVPSTVHNVRPSSSSSSPAFSLRTSSTNNRSSSLPFPSVSSPSIIALPTIDTLRRLTLYFSSMFVIKDTVTDYERTIPSVITNYGLPPPPSPPDNTTSSTGNRKRSITTSTTTSAPETPLFRKKHRLVNKALEISGLRSTKDIRLSKLMKIVQRSTGTTSSRPTSVTILQYIILFTSLCRSLGYATRLVYTLDPLLLSRSPKDISQGKGMETSTEEDDPSISSSSLFTGSKAKRHRVNTFSDHGNTSYTKSSSSSSSLPGNIYLSKPSTDDIFSSKSSFHGTATVNNSSTSVSLPTEKTSFISPSLARKLPGIRYWIEIYGIAPSSTVSSSSSSSISSSLIQRWIYLDPVRQWFDCPQLIEPTLRSKNNPLTYVLAANQQNQLFDVTRRYTLQWSQVQKLRDLQGMNVPSLLVPEQAIMIQRRLQRNGIVLGKQFINGNNGTSKGKTGTTGKRTTTTGTRKRPRSIDEILQDGQFIPKSNDLPPEPYETWFEHTLRIHNQKNRTITGTIRNETVVSPQVTADSVSNSQVHRNSSSSSSSSSSVIDLTGEDDHVPSRSKHRSKPPVRSLPVPPPSSIDEETELVQSSTSNETFPTKITDYQNHPRYAIESQLTIWQTIHPKTSSDILGYFKGMVIYPRSNVHYLRTVDQWLKQYGRSVRKDQLSKPVKRIPKSTASAANTSSGSSRGRGSQRGGGGGSFSSSAASSASHHPFLSPIEFDFRYNNLHTVPQHNKSTVDIVQRMLDQQNSVESSSVPAITEYVVYGEWQTEPYVPLPVAANEPLPKNRFGNFELFHPAFLPSGLIHIAHPKAKQSAEKLAIEYAEAVTGFRPRPNGFGNGGVAGAPLFVPDVQGIVIHAHHEESVQATIEAFEQQEIENESSKREKRVRKRWETFVRGILIKDRIDREYGSKGTVRSSTLSFPSSSSSSSFSSSPSSTTTLSSAVPSEKLSGSAESVANIIHETQRSQKVKDEVYASKHTVDKRKGKHNENSSNDDGSDIEWESE